MLGPEASRTEDEEQLLPEVHRAEPWAAHMSKACDLCGRSQAWANQPVH